MKMPAKDGAVAAIVKNQSIPRMLKIKQEFNDYKINDIETEVKKKLLRSGTLDRIKPGQSIAITSGSRGIANIAKVTKSVVDEVKRVGGFPFIVPAMGSHGGATAQGQKDVLASFNITEETMGCPIKSSMETVRVGISEYGKPVHIDKYSVEADGIIVVGRVKPHTSFRGKYESGLVKMITIGLGKQFGAEICHGDSFKYMVQNITSMAKTALEKCNIIFGIALIENAYDETSRIEAIPSEKLFDEEPDLLIEAKENMPSIMFDEIDVLIVDEIGKNISGAGMDPNITGSFTSTYASGGVNRQRIVILDITEETHGNGVGLGLADFASQRVFDKTDFEKVYANVLTSTVLTGAKIPVIMPNDKLAIQAAIRTCNKINYDNPRIVRIKNTLCLREIYISESLMEQAKKNPRMKILKEPKELHFDIYGNLYRI